MLNVNSKFMKKTIEKLIWLMIKMKLMCLVIALATTSLNAEVWSQQKKISLRLGETGLEQLFEEMQQQSLFLTTKTWWGTRGAGLCGE